MSKLLCLGVLLVAPLLAAPPVATVESPGTFTLRGRSITPDGIGHWPVYRGNTVAAGDTAVLLRFRDGSQVLLARNSEVVVSDEAGRAQMKLVKGRVSYQSTGTSGLLLEGVAKSTARVGELRVAPTGELKDVADVGYFAVMQRQAAVDAPIAITYGTLPGGVVTTPGPAPVSSYRN